MALIMHWNNTHQNKWIMFKNINIISSLVKLLGVLAILSDVAMA